MAAPGIQLLTGFQLGKESTAGTTVAATRQWYGQGSGEVDIDDMLAMHRGNRGTRTNLVGASTKGVAVNIGYQSDSEMGCAYDELIYPFGQLDGGNAGVAGTSDYVWTIAPSQTGANSQESYTIEVFDNTQEIEFGYCQAKDFTLSASMDGMTQLGINWFARQPVKSTKTSVAANTAVRIPGYLWAPKFATAQSGLAGASETLNFLRDFSVTYQTGLIPRFYMDGLPYFNQSVEALPMSATITLHVESLALAVSEFYDKKRAQTVSFLQLSTGARGPALGSSTYACQLQFAVLYTDVKPIASVDEGVNIYEITAETVYDPTWTQSIGASITSAVATIT